MKVSFTILLYYSTVLFLRIFIFYQGLMRTKWDPIEYYFTCTLIFVLNWPEDADHGRNM